MERIKLIGFDNIIAKLIVQLKNEKYESGDYSITYDGQELQLDINSIWENKEEFWNTKLFPMFTQKLMAVEILHCDVFVNGKQFQLDHKQMHYLCRRIWANDCTIQIINN